MNENYIITLSPSELFEIKYHDQNTPYIKKLRVVITITYSLKD